MIRALCAFALVLTLSLISSKSACGADDASQPAYSGGWSNGSNGGTQFQPWILNPPVNGSSGFFVFNSNNNGSNAGPGINSGANVAWGTYGNSGNNAVATRPFITALAAGETFAAQMDNGFIDGGSSVGIRLADSSGTPRFVFQFTGGTSNYQIIDGSGTVNTTLGFTDTGLTTALDLINADTYLFTVTTGTGATYQRTATLGGTAGSAIDRFIAFNNNAGFGGTNDAYFNRISISPVPEPASILLVCGLGSVAVNAVRRRRRR